MWSVASKPKHTSRPPQLPTKRSVHHKSALTQFFLAPCSWFSIVGLLSIALSFFFPIPLRW